MFYGFFHDFRCLVVGSDSVGKTSLLVTQATGLFPREHLPTVFQPIEGKPKSNILILGKKEKNAEDTQLPMSGFFSKGPTCCTPQAKNSQSGQIQHYICILAQREKWRLFLYFSTTNKWFRPIC